MASVFGEQTLVENDDLTSVEFKPPRCLDFFNMWRFCASSRNQFHQYYIYGKFQDCSMYSKAMKSCISYKATKSIEDRDLMLEALKTQEIKFTSASVWEKRENPGLAAKLNFNTSKVVYCDVGNAIYVSSVEYQTPTSEFNLLASVPICVVFDIVIG